EPEREFANRGVRAVRGVNEVLRGLEREVAADRPRRGLVRASRADHRPNDGDRIRPLERGGDERARGDEVDKPAEERLLAVDRVVALGEIAVDLDQLEADELEPALLEARQDSAGQQALHSV